MTGLSEYAISYQVSPIILVAGVAGTGMLPIVAVLSSYNYDLGVLFGSSGSELERDYFGQFRVVPGGTLIENEVATYPVANQSVAANAIITDPLRVTLEMVVPANDQVTMDAKLGIMTALKSTLDDHIAQGGYFNVATPSYIYQGCLLTSLVDATDETGDGAQVQIRWLWNFMQPLLTVAAAQAAQNQFMSKLSAQTRNTGDPPGSQPIATGVSQPSSNIVQNVVPSARNPAGSNVAPSSAPSGSNNLGAISPVSPGLI